MPGFVIPAPVFRAWDTNGDPLAGGKLYSYAAGTSTPLATYTDEQLTTPHTNPIILDASGEATIFIEDGVAYKFNLLDADDVQQDNWPVDNIEIISPTPVVPPSPVPTGGIMAYGGTSAPTGFLICDGSAVSRTTYAALFAILGSTFGGGDGSTTFEIPDMRGFFPFGKATSGTGSTLGGTFGDLDHTHTGPSHTHSVTVPRDNWGAAIEAPPAVDGRIRVSLIAGTGTDANGVFATAAQAVTSAAGGTGATGSANPPALALNFIVKT
jgi:microcystin-dependent protein